MAHRPPAGRRRRTPQAAGRTGPGLTIAGVGNVLSAITPRAGQSAVKVGDHLKRGSTPEAQCGARRDYHPGEARRPLQHVPGNLDRQPLLNACHTVTLHTTRYKQKKMLE